MTLSQILFGFSGRLARLPYFGYSLVALVLLALAFFFIVNVFITNPALGLAGVLVIGIVAIWTSLAITAKRLHDLGLSGGHVIWMFGLGAMSRVTSPTNPGLGMLFGLAELIAWLWLLFAPGQPAANAYGPEPA
jgi:uncharacterized membrane protein YhaH (DUF805 family)